MALFPRLLVLAAMKEELDAVSAVLNEHPVQAARVGRLLQITVYTYTFGARSLRIALSGMGPVNAALTLATIAEHHDFDGVILLGVGGALVSGLQVGHAVISKRVLQHDSYSSLDSGDIRMAAGELILSEAEAVSHSPAIPADPGLIELISRSLPPGASSLGAIISGNEFVGTLARKQTLQTLDSEAMLVDMEAAGVAQLSKRLGLPFVVVKTVADRLHADGTIEADFRRCLASASSNAARILHRALTSPL